MVIRHTGPGLCHLLKRSWRNSSALSSQRWRLFSDFNIYKELLPVRLFKKLDSESRIQKRFIKLYTHRYLIHPTVMAVMVRTLAQLESLPIRNSVQYVAALIKQQVFYLRFFWSTGLLHTIFILPSTTMVGGISKWSRGIPARTAKLLLIKERLLSLIVWKYCWTVTNCLGHIWLLPPDILHTVRAMDDYLKISLGANCRALFHLDEHKKMCELSESKKGAEFSWGAFEALLSLEAGGVVRRFALFSSCEGEFVRSVSLSCDAGFSGYRPSDARSAGA